MYQNLLFGVKRRILTEVENAFLNHPVFSPKVEVSNKFPFNERLQIGVVLRNSSASQIRMSADNYMADISSHVRLVKQRNYPGTSIEWVKEDEPNITNWYEEDFTTRVDPTQILYTTAYQMLNGAGNTHYAESPLQIKILKNEVEIRALSVDGENKQVYLDVPPNSGDTLKICYYRRVLADPGMYQVSFLSDTEFVVRVMYQIEDELVIEKTTGLESSETLQRFPMSESSEQFYLDYENRKDSDPVIYLQRNTEYSLDYVTGIVTFLQPLPANYILKASYYTQISDPWGPFTFKAYQEVHNAIPGVVICMGRRAVADDLQGINVSKFREPQARIYGGHWNMTLSLGVIAKDSIQMEEMVDQIVNWLWAVRKNQLEYEGITLNRVEPTGESEETFIETTGDLYFESTVDVDLMSEWQKFTPYPYALRLFNITLWGMEPDTRTVIKLPTVGYETVS
jgi:hypothetical protein